MSENPGLLRSPVAVKTAAGRSASKGLALDLLLKLISDSDRDFRQAAAE